MHSLRHPTSLRSLLILSPHLGLGPSSSQFQTKTMLCTSHHTHMLAICPTHHMLLNFITLLISFEGCKWTYYTADTQISYYNGYVLFTLEQTTKAHRGSRGIALLFF
jgi:hypothetical protein